MRLESLQSETQSNSMLQMLSDYIRMGLPKSIQDLPATLQPYWCFRDELAILYDLVMKGNRVVVPATMKAGTLERLHDAHQDQTSALQRAQ